MWDVQWGAGRLRYNPAVVVSTIRTEQLGLEARKNLFSVQYTSICFFFISSFSLRKLPTFHEVATWALTKRRLSNERRNSILMTFTTQILVVLLIGWNFLSINQKHYQDLGGERHEYGISALVTQTSFCEGSSGDLVKRRLFSQATLAYNCSLLYWFSAQEKSRSRIVRCGNWSGNTYAVHPEPRSATSRNTSNSS